MKDKRLTDKIITYMCMCLIILIILVIPIIINAEIKNIVEENPVVGYNLVIYDNYDKDRIVYKYDDIIIISTGEHSITFSCINKKGNRVTKSLYTADYELESYEKEGKSNEK